MIFYFWKVPDVYQATFPHLFDTERVDPMCNPYWYPEVTPVINVGFVTAVSG